MTSSYISAQDGMGTTIMLSENADAYTWPGLVYTDTTNQERYLGFGYHSVDSTPGDPSVTPPPTPGDPYHINVKYSQSKTGGGTPLAQKVFMRPSAYHPSGVNMAFCDGRVRFINEDISYGVFQALMTPRGSQGYINTGTPSAMLGTPANPGTPVHAATKTIDEAAIQ
jgi:prepilin-type processing-associated H-X9-DG protein